MAAIPRVWSDRHENALIEAGVFKDADAMETARSAHKAQIDRMREWLNPLYANS